MDHRRLLAYVIFALVLGPLLVSAIPLIAPEREAGESVKAASSSISADEKPEIRLDRVERGRRPIPLPLLWLLDLSIALLVYLTARRLILGAS
ncbi:hypothetical protein J7L65_00785 [Candidatus Bathyarchaeota archaeon]|nr:hypothetical protein [Candidatus Bathyarchaeota archaeon]